MALIGKLVELAGMWADASGRSLPRLATKVANDGKLFERLNAGGTCTVATFERFTTHLSDPVHWPENRVPTAAQALLHRMGRDADLVTVDHVGGNA